MVVQGVPGHAKLKPVTVMVVDDHPALRAGLRSLIASDPALRVLVEVGSGEAAYAAYRSLRPDAVVMDLSMEGCGGIEAIRRIRDLDRKRRSWSIACIIRRCCSSGRSRPVRWAS
jgi:DNA-binding NarL/FixJ family response regulator